MKRPPLDQAGSKVHALGQHAYEEQRYRRRHERSRRARLRRQDEERRWWDDTHTVTYEEDEND